MIFLLKFWMNASNMKQSECRLKFTWFNLTRKLKTILLFSHFSLTDIFSSSTWRILSRTKGVRMYDCITWKHIINLNIDCSYSCIVLFCFNDNGDSVARPTSFQNRRKHDRKPSEFIVHDRISGLIEGFHRFCIRNPGFFEDQTNEFGSSRKRCVVVQNLPVRHILENRKKCIMLLFTQSLYWFFFLPDAWSSLYFLTLNLLYFTFFSRVLYFARILYLWHVQLLWIMYMYDVCSCSKTRIDRCNSHKMICKKKKFPGIKSDSRCTQWSHFFGGGGLSTNNNKLIKTINDDKKNTKLFYLKYRDWDLTISEISYNCSI